MKAGARGIPPYPRRRDALLLCLIALGIQVLVGLVLAVVMVTGWSMGALTSAMTLLAGALSMVVVLVLGAGRNARALPEATGGPAWNPKALAAALILPFGLFAFNTVLAQGLMRAFGPARAINTGIAGLLGQGAWSVAIFILYMCVVAPVLEELFFRGFLLSGMRGRLGTAPAILFTATLFALIHLNPTQVVSGFFLGLVLGALAARTRNLRYPILLHALYNCMSLVFPLLLPRGPAKDRWCFFVIGSYRFDLIDLAALASLAAGLLFLVLSPAARPGFFFARPRGSGLGGATIPWRPAWPGRRAATAPKALRRQPG
jgi:membrane protease YdiL (CAAX protease family)